LPAGCGAAGRLAGDWQYFRASARDIAYNRALDCRPAAPLLSAFGDFLMRFHSLPRLEQSGRLCYSSFCFIDFEINIKKE
jgi:hypothetical protein